MWTPPIVVAVVGILLVSSHASAWADKGRVPKPKSPPSSPPPATPQVAQSDNSDSENMGACIGDCFSFLDGLFGDDEHKSTAAAPAASRADALGPDGASWKVHDRAWLKGAAVTDSVVLWANPYDPHQADVEGARLPVGTAVTIIERHEMSDRLELRVVRADDIEPVGWVPSTALAASLAEAVSPRPAADTAASKPKAPLPPDRPWWGIRIAPGIGGLVSGDLESEYDPGFHLEAAYSREVSRYLPLGFSLGFWNMKGHPEFDYRTPTGLDTPENSTFRMASMALDFGVRAGKPRKPVFFLTVGPSLYYVHEDADIQTTIFVVTPPDTTAVPGPSRSESLDRVAGGGVARTGIGFLVGAVEIGFQLDVNAIVWDGHREKSLTTDYTHNGIYVVDFSLEFTFGGH